ncbi:MAG: glycosyltransferase family 4 protein [Acidimicrobiia bacterium]|nr:glycosyltransferase family 4 protein [Acidimicrobiia bacterium]
MSLALLLGHQLRAFGDAGYEVTGVSGPGPFVAELTEFGVAHHSLPSLTRAVDPRADLRAPIDLFRLFRRLRPDIVHTHNPKPGVYGRVAARAARVPAVVNTVHGLYALPEDTWSKRAAVYGLERAAVTCSDAEFVQNPEDVETLRRLHVPDRKLHLLGNGIDLTRFEPGRIGTDRVAAIRASVGAGADDVVCGLVGRLVWEKGYGEVFAAVEALRGRLPNLRVFVAGPRDEAKADAVTTADLARAERLGITFLGMRDDVDALYAAMDLYVLASYREGWPRSAMEASAMGVPVIATNIRGCRQVVDDGVTGLLVPPRDAGALERAIEQLASDPALRRSMGQAARRKARSEFDEQRVIATTLAVYEQLLSDRPEVST